VTIRPGSILLIAAVVIVIIGLLQIIQTSKATTRTFEIQKLEQQKLQLGAEVRDLEAQVAGMSSLPRIQAESQRLGLVRAQSIEAVTVNIAMPDDSVDRLPSRFAAGAVQLHEAETDSPWWRDVIGLLPFN
jgi:hypothetical protein